MILCCRRKHLLAIKSKMKMEVMWKSKRNAEIAKCSSRWYLTTNNQTDPLQLADIRTTGKIGSDAAGS